MVNADLSWCDHGMLGFLIRRLPFWVREPLLVVIGFVFGVRIMYVAVRDQDLAAAGIGAVFLLVAAISVYRVVKALRARRNPSPAVSAPGTVVAAVAPVQASAPVSGLGLCSGLDLCSGSGPGPGRRLPVRARRRSSPVSGVRPSQPWPCSG